MAVNFGPLDEMLSELLETWEHRYHFEFNREQRVIAFSCGEMIARAMEQPGGLIIVSYESAPGELESEFCTPGQAAALIDAVMGQKELCLLPKYGRPPLLVMEFSKGAARALALEFYPDNADSFVQELTRAKTAVHNWRIKHGARCEMVLFTVVSVAEHHIAIESLIRRACCESGEFGPFLKSLEVRVNFLIDPRGDPVKQCILAAGSQVSAES
jgi:hypothetical protein